MRRTVRLSSQFRKPSIKFLGKRALPSAPDVAHPHPQAPPGYQRTFGASQQTSGSPATDSPSSLDSQTSSFSQFWEAPPRYWNYRVHSLEESEMDSIMSGGASSA